MRLLIVTLVGLLVACGEVAPDKHQPSPNSEQIEERKKSATIRDARDAGRADHMRNQIDDLIEKEREEP